jgi:hypothetical protein
LALSVGNTNRLLPEDRDFFLDIGFRAVIILFNEKVEMRIMFITLTPRKRLKAERFPLLTLGLLL